MRVLRECYQVEQTLSQQLPALRPAQRRGLALWVVGTLLADSACQSAVQTALEPLGYGAWATRQYLREWLYDGADRAAPCGTGLAVRGCFLPLLCWVLRWWQGTELPLALDATNLLGDRLVALVVSIPYRGCALPIAWRVVPGTASGSWMTEFLALLALVQPAVPPDWRVLVLADRGLWSPRLWDGVRPWGWHPVLRLTARTVFRPQGQRQRVRATTLVAGPGHAWIGAGEAFRDKADRRVGTLLVVWAVEQPEPWVLLSDLPPTAVEGSWYGMRAWIELGFRAMKSMGWHWQRTRRADPTRVERHLLVLAVVMLLTVAVGTRVEDADRLALPPARLRAPRPTPLPARSPRRVSVFARGRSWLRLMLFHHRRLWTRLWLLPDPWPAPAPSLQIHRVVPPQPAYLPL